MSCVASLLLLRLQRLPPAQVASATTLLVMAVPFQERVRAVSPDTIYISLIFVCVGSALLIYAFAAFRAPPYMRTHSTQLSAHLLMSALLAMEVV